MKKVVLVAVNARFSHSNLALFYFKQLLNRASDFNPQLFEFTIKDRPVDILGVLLESLDGDPHAFLFSAYIWNSSLIKELVLLLKALRPDIPVIVGGPEAGYNAQVWLKETPADFIIKGAGEPVLLPLLEGTLHSRLVESPGVDFDTVPFPYDDRDLALLKNRLVYYETSRGCPFSCSYCLSSCEGQDLQFRDLDKVKKELRILAYSGARVIKLVDRSFNVDASRARAIWSFLLELKNPCSFHFEVHPLFLEEEDFQLFSRVPPELFHFEVGIQSTSDEELKAVNRVGSWNRIEPPIRRLIEETSIPVHLDQIVALPGADAESVKKSFNQILSLHPGEFQMGFLKLLPGTELLKGAGQFMIASPSAPYEVIETPLISFQELRYFHRIEELLNSYYNSGLFTHTMNFLLRERAEFAQNPFLFFEKLQQAFKDVSRIKPLQWARLGETLWKVFGNLEEPESLQLKDALRLDWAPLSQGQYLPAFLNYSDVDRIKGWRRALWPLCEARGIRSSEFKKSILIWQEHLQQGEDLILFIPIGKERRSWSFVSSSLLSGESV